MTDQGSGASGSSSGGRTEKVCRSNSNRSIGSSSSNSSSSNTGSGGGSSRLSVLRPVRRTTAATMMTDARLWTLVLFVAHCNWMVWMNHSIVPDHDTVVLTTYKTNATSAGGSGATDGNDASWLSANTTPQGRVRRNRESGSAVRNNDSDNSSRRSVKSRASNSGKSRANNSNTRAVHYDQGLGAQQGEQQQQQQQQQQREQPQQPQRPKLLYGIFTADFASEIVYRQRHRDIFGLWNDSRVCTLHDFVNANNANAATNANNDHHHHHHQAKMTSIRTNCELIYTFVLGANPNATTELLDNATRPWLWDDVHVSDVDNNGSTPPTRREWTGADVNQTDVTRLNICENMENGKSQSWFAYASSMATQYGIDYITKADSDSILHVDEYFVFANRYMKPAPYNERTLQCIPFDKKHWPVNAAQDAFFNDQYNRVHNYCSGELYTLSTDLAVALVTEAQRLNGTCPYCGGREDHDVSSMVFYSTAMTHDVINFVMMSRRHVYWTHRVKLKNEPWRTVWSRQVTAAAAKAAATEAAAATAVL